MQLDSISPLRYPGGKKFLFPYIDSIIKEKLYLGCDFYEPYAGGASISLFLLLDNTISKAFLVEKDPLIYSFWKSAIYQADSLCEKIDKLDLSLNTWRKFQKYLKNGSDQKFDCVTLGLAGLFFNRVNYSGILKSGPIGGYEQNSKYKIDCRFNKKRIIDLIQKISGLRGRISITQGDGVSYLKSNAKKIEKNGFVYIDPPYYSNGKRLYRCYFKEFQHKKLSLFLQSQNFPWIASYDFNKEVLNNFYGQKIIAIYLNYAISRSYKVKELIISNFALPKPHYITSSIVKVPESFKNIDNIIAATGT